MVDTQLLKSTKRKVRVRVEELDLLMRWKISKGTCIMFRKVDEKATMV